MLFFKSDGQPCQQTISDTTFGLCDDVHGSPARVERWDNSKPMAQVINKAGLAVVFTAIDHCLDLPKDMKRCDCCLNYREHTEDATLIFIELKDRTSNNWAKDGKDQLRATIAYFEQCEEAPSFKVKRAYLANSARP